MALEQPANPVRNRFNKTPDRGEPVQVGVSEDSAESAYPRWALRTHHGSFVGVAWRGRDKGCVCTALLRARREESMLLGLRGLVNGEGVIVGEEGCGGGGKRRTRGRGSTLCNMTSTLDAFFSAVTKQLSAAIGRRACLISWLLTRHWKCGSPGITYMYRSGHPRDDRVSTGFRLSLSIFFSPANL